MSLDLLCIAFIYFPCASYSVTLNKTQTAQLTIFCLLMVRVLEGLMQLLGLIEQAEAFEHLGSTIPSLLAAMLVDHLLLDVLELLVGKVLHQHGLEHLWQWHSELISTAMTHTGIDG